MLDELGFHVIDATGSIEQQQKQMRAIVLRELGASLRNEVLKTTGVETAYAEPAAPRIL